MIRPCTPDSVYGVLGTLALIALLYPFARAAEWVDERWGDIDAVFGAVGGGR